MRRPRAIAIRFVANGIATIVFSAGLKAAHAFPSSRFVYSRASGAEQCPDEGAMRKEVAVRLGYDPFFPAAERTIVARIERQRQALRATVDLLDAHGIVRGSRSLESTDRDCVELAKSLALAISIGIDPAYTSAPLRAAESTDDLPVARDAPPTPPPASATPSPDRSPTADTTTDPSRKPARMDPVRLELSVGTWAAVGLAPRVSFGGSAGVGATYRWWSISLEGRGGPKAGGDVEVALWAFSLVPCVREPPFVLCLSGSFGALRGEASRSASARYLAVGARAALEVPLGRAWSVRPRFDLAAPLDRTILQVNGANVWQLPLLAESLGFDLSVHFP